MGVIMKVFHIPVAAALCVLAFVPATMGAAVEIEITFPAEAEERTLDGRVILLISTAGDTEPRFQTRPGVNAIQIFGIDINGLSPGEAVRFDATVKGYPIDSLDDLPPGTYRAQAVLHRYETFQRSDGHTLKLPMDRGEGQQWNRAPGNLYSTPSELTLEGHSDNVVRIELDNVIPPIEPVADTEHVRHVRIQSKLLSEFWGRPIYLGAHVLLPYGFEE
ncbi:MAG: hypothetical protein KAI97_08145, partial [Gemmatimonadetes bacterium]|nr:hypothetical protein [Gemmatimonadota bacterium]